MQVAREGEKGPAHNELEPGSILVRVDLLRKSQRGCGVVILIEPVFPGQFDRLEKVIGSLRRVAVLDPYQAVGRIVVIGANQVEIDDNALPLRGLLTAHRGNCVLWTGGSRKRQTGYHKQS